MDGASFVSLFIVVVVIVVIFVLYDSKSWALCVRISCV